MALELAQCGWRDKLRLNDYLAESWEPFAVTEPDNEATIWLRRSARPEDARVVELPWQPRREPEVA